MVTQSYGTYSPQAIDPFPIETDLAKASISSPVDAQSLLDLYQTQRATSEGNYNYAMQGQHDFAKQQLAQQLYEANLKALPELSKPGVAGILANAPQYQGVFGGASPEAIARAVAQADQTTQATNLEHAGAGTLSLSSAGMPLTPGAVQGITGLPINPGVRPDIQIGAGHDAARLGAAAIGAANSGGIGFNIKLPVSEATGGQEVSAAVPGKYKGGLTRAVTELQGGGYIPTNVSPPPPPGATPPSTQVTPPPKKGLTNLTPAKPDTYAKPVPNSAPGADLLQQRAQTYVNGIKATNPAAYNDIMAYAATNGGKIGLIGPDKQGRYTMQGKEHTY